MINSISGIVKHFRLIEYTCQCHYSSTFLNDDKYKNDYKILNINEGADQETVRNAFLLLCKKYHPDSGHPEANAEKFEIVDTAYRRLLKKFANDRWSVNDDVGEYGLYYKEEKEKNIKEYDISHTAPQHRQYLSYDGVGSGSPSQRQQQYSHYRATQAADRVREHRVENLEQTGDTLTVADRRRIKNIKTRYGIERLVEDMIQESMARGDFKNLSGAGKPLKQGTFNPYVDTITHKMNEIMIENGFTPEWITLGRDIDFDKSKILSKLAAEKKWINNPKRWNAVVEELRSATKDLNKKIQLFNLIVPILRQQMLLFDFEKHLKQVIDEHQQ